MSDLKISQLPQAGALTGDELIALVQGGVTKKEEISALLSDSNIRINERIIPFLSSPTDTEIAQVVASINAALPVVVPNGFLQVFSFVQQTGIAADTADPQLVQFQKVRYILKRGAGTYGSGGTAVVNNDVMFLGVESIVATNVFELGNIGATAIHTFVNGSGPYIINGLTIFTATISSVDKLFIFSGANGTYGDGAIQTTVSNFIDFASAPVLPVPNIPYLQSRPEAGATYTLLSTDLNRTVVFENAVVITIPNSVFADDVATRQQAWFSFKSTGTINYPTTDGLSTLAVTAGALVYVERRNISNEWIVKRVDSFTSGTVESVTGVGVDNTDPANPVIINPQSVTSTNETIPPSKNGQTIFSASNTHTFNPNTQTYQSNFEVIISNTGGGNATFVATAATGWTYVLNNNTPVSSLTETFTKSIIIERVLGTNVLRITEFQEMNPVWSSYNWD